MLNAFAVFLMTVLLTCHQRFPDFLQCCQMAIEMVMALHHYFRFPYNNARDSMVCKQKSQSLTQNV